jgi:uncharacterized protein (TIGR03067 family)
MRLLILLLSLAFTVSSWANPKQEGDHKSAATIKGKWRLIDQRLDKLKMVVEWEFTDTEVVVREVKTGEETSRASYKIDASKTPQWITVDVDDSPDGKSGDKRLGIFRIQGKELHLKQELADGAARPAGFNDGFTRFERVPATQKAEPVNPSSTFSPKSKSAVRGAVD